MRTARGLGFVVGALLLGASAVAHATPESDRAQVLFDEARDLARAGRFTEACPKFEASQRLDPGAGTLLNLADCYEKSGKIATAWRTYQKVVEASERTSRKEWATHARESAGRLSPSLSTLTIEVPKSADVPGLVVERDGAAVNRDEWGKPVFVDPGEHLIIVRSPEKEPQEHRLMVGGAASVLRVVVDAGDIKEHSETSEPKEASSGQGQRTAGYVAGAAGIVGLGIGAVFGLSAIGSKHDAERDGHCTVDLQKCDAVGKASMSDSRDAARLSTIGFIAGGALAATGIVLVLTAPSNKDPASATQGRRTTVRFTGSSVVLGGTF